MSEFYKIIKSFKLEEEEMDKLQIYLIHNCEKEEILLSALKRYETIESKQRFLKSFIKSISDEHQGMPLRRNDWSTQT
ncbi:hypothetical protein RclHR1_05460007 [Rhizophagus clarus]|uniref:Uncharacterized protein n=1 Tax=Rhizophagus clarus TaxID=94130 RepID=A0A2Z6RNG6_9GLOM|nr:hypothetical protein RclHR1_05460007 [Rhizophagus clarus]GES91368.1 hypothetical protein GLOIN_2v1781498 [Rhizophagus clarus]